MTLKEILIAGKLTVSEGGGGGGGGESSNIDTVSLKDVVFIDYDGEVVYNYTADEFLAMDAMPANPSHSGLVAQGWNWSLADAKEYVEENGMLVVGQNYTTDDGTTKLYFTCRENMVGEDLFISIVQTVSNGVEVDWGDGSDVEKKSGTGQKGFTHAYDVAGDYIVKIKAVSGTYTLGRFAANQGFLGSNENRTGSIARTGISSVEVGDNVTAIEQGAFAATYIKSISLPSSLANLTTSNRPDSFNNAFNLKALVIPNGCFVSNGSSQSVFAGCINIRFIAIPKNIVEINLGGSGSFTNLRMLTLPPSTKLFSNNLWNALRLEKLSIPGTYTEIPSSFVRQTQALERIVVPASVTKINTASIAPAVGIKEYVMRPTTPPTLGSAGVNGLTVAEGVKIIVPYSSDHSVLDAYKAAANWSTYANYIVEEDAP